MQAIENGDGRGLDLGRSIEMIIYNALRSPRTVRGIFYSKRRADLSWLSEYLDACPAAIYRDTHSDPVNRAIMLAGWAWLKRAGWPLRLRMIPRRMPR